MIGSKGWRGNLCVPVMPNENEADINTVRWLTGKGWMPSEKIGNLRYDPVLGKFWETHNGVGRDVTEELLKVILDPEPDVY